MESEFNRLPIELTEEILARVRGVLEVVRLRLVCRAWNCQIQSSTFSALHSRIATPEPWLVTVRRTSPANQKLYLFDRSLQSWVLPPLQFLKEFVCDFSTCKSAGGLVCCVATTVKPRGIKSVLVFNPITRGYKLLPAPPILGSLWGAKVEMAMSREERTGEYKVALCGGGRERSVRVYDSRKEKWEKGERPGRAAAGDVMPRMEGYRNGTTEKVCWYEVAEDRWREAELPETQKIEVRNPAVIHEAGGERLLLAGVLRRNNDGRAEGFAVWELAGGEALNNSPPQPFPRPDGNRVHLSPPRHRRAPPPGPDRTQPPLVPQRAPRQEHLRDPSRQTPFQQPGNNNPSSKWTEISRTPPRFLKEPHGALRLLNDSTLVCHGEMVCMSGVIRHAISPWNCFYPWLLVYDIGQDRWDWSPQPLGSKTWANFHIVCVLQPNLAGFL